MKKSHEGKRSIFLSALLAQAVWGMSSVILLLIFCTVACSTEDPERITGPLALCALYLSSMSGGIAAVRLSGDGLVSGILSGILTVLLVWCISLLPLPSAGYEVSQSLMGTFIIIPVSMLGAILGHKRTVKPGMKTKLKKNIR